MQHINDELRRIEERLFASPDPFEHAGLYTAQQALRWAVQPELYASPFSVVTGSGEGSKDCYSGSSLPLSGDTSVQT